MIREKINHAVATGLVACMLLGGAWAEPVNVLAESPTGTPYNSEGVYDVSIGHVIINQVYGGGNNKGGGSHGFIELYNPTDQAVDLSSWSVQYQGAASDDKNTAGWHKLDLTGSIPAHSSYLIRTKKYKDDTTPANYAVPTGDQEWSDLTINGKGVCVALMSNQNLLSDNNVFNSSTRKPEVEGYVDMVGVNGNDSKAEQKAPAYEGYTTDTQSTKKGVRRVAFQDTDCNGVGNDDGDFIIIEYNAVDEKYMEWAHPRTTADGEWAASEMPAFTETTQLSSSSINTLTNTFGSDSSTTRQFKWQMPSSFTEGKVVISQNADMSSSIETTATRTTNQKGDASVFSAAVTGLKANTGYYYQVVSGSIVSETYSFTTGTESGEFTFVHASDSQSKAESGYDDYQNAIEAINSEYKPSFILESGDLVDTNYFEDEWRWLIGKSQNVFASTAFIPVVGNHEQNSSYDAYAFREHFNVPNACEDANVTPGTVYSFDYGQAHFVILNSECKGEGLNAQAEWLKKDLANTKQKYIIASMHRGLYGASGIATDVKDAFLPVFDEYKVDLVLFGHDHSYVRTKALKNNAEDPDGTVYLQGGGCASKQDAAADVMPEYAEVTGTPGMPVYNVVTVNDQTISVKTVTVDSSKTISDFENNASLKKSSEDKTVSFSVKPKQRTAESAASIENAVVSGIVIKNYNGKSQTQASMKVQIDGTTLKAGTDYEVSYKNNKNLGTASVVITGIGDYTGSITKTFKITVSRNKTYTVGDMKYKVSNASTSGKGTVTLVGTSRKKSQVKTLTIPRTVKIGGKTYHITSIGSAAFQSYSSLRSVKIGSDVKSIGRSAFRNCHRLSRITIQSTQLKSVGSYAIRSINKRAVIDAPNSKISSYKKLFKSSTGYTRTMKIK